MEYKACYEPTLAEKCVYGSDFVREILGVENGYSNIFLKPREYPISNKKLEGFIRLNEERNYYQQNPVKFFEDFFRTQLLDSQAYLMQAAWPTKNVVIVASRAFGKSLWIAWFIMAKQMLSSDPWNCYIASGSAEQSATTFRKLEDVANDRISSLRGSTGKLFKNEVVVNAANGDGFSHNPSGFTYKIYNDSFTKTLSSNVDRSRGARSDCVVFDECGFLDGNLIEVYKAFCAVDNSFATGFDDNGNSIDMVRLMAMPQSLPKQLVYVSSASSVDTEFYKIYRDYSKQMIAGDPDYFVANIDCELAMRPTIHNVPTVSALTRDMIEATMRTNPIKGRREYYCEFSEDAGADAIIRRGVITRNEETRVPLLYNDTGDKRFILAYDPARSMDNSVIGVMELYTVMQVDGSLDLRGRIVNCANLMDVGKKLKTPMQTPDQVRYLKQMILDYNAGADAYGNIANVYIDAGSGGGGVNIGDYLMQDWETGDGIIHRGLIDKEYSSEYVGKFPNAVDKIKLLSPSAYKPIIFESLIEMMNQDKISFTSEYDNKGYLTIFDIDEDLLAKEREKIIESLQKKKLNQKQFEEQLEAELDKVQSVNTKVQRLTWQEELALANIDAMKEEITSIVRKKRDSGRDSFDLTPERARILHDDRAYVLAMLGYGLAQERRKLLLNKKPKTDTKTLAQKLTIRRGSYGGKII